MATYLDRTLAADEDLVYQAKVHWMIYLPAIIVMILGVPGVMTTLAFLFSGDGLAPTWIIFAVGLLWFVWLHLVRINTEMFVTTKRVVIKTGVIARKTIELNLKRVESFSVDQSILGRMFNYGTVNVLGTGGVVNKVKNVDDPLTFRAKVVAMVDAVQ